MYPHPGTPRSAPCPRPPSHIQPSPPQPLIKLRHRHLPHLKRPDEPRQSLTLGRPLCDSLRHFDELYLGSLVPLHQAVVAFLVLPLVLGNPRILGDAVLRYLHQHRHLLPPCGFMQLHKVKHPSHAGTRKQPAML